MNIIEAIIVILFGLAIGSFLNVVIYRIDDLRSILKSRSHCMSCKKILKWYDLVPFISFIVLRAKCRYCGEKISWQYPIVEVSTALVFLLLFLMFGLSWNLVFYAVLFSILEIVFVYDLNTENTPEFFVWFAVVLALLGGWYFGNISFLESIYGGLIGGGALAIMVYASREKWMGSGDIKVGLILGLILGYPIIILGLFLAFLAGSIVGLTYIKLAGKTIKDSLPFTPFLIFSLLVSLLYGKVVMGWYLGSFIY